MRSCTPTAGRLATVLATVLAASPAAAAVLTPVVTNSFGTAPYSVAWHPDGNYLAVGGANTVTDVIVYRFNGTNLATVATTDFGTSARTVAWSPCGRYLAVAGDNSANDLVVYAFDGLSLALVDSHDMGSAAYGVAWHPDCRALAVAGSNTSEDLVILSFDGTTLTMITNLNYGSIARQVVWSPDGQYLAVGGGTPNNGYETQIYTFNGLSLTQMPEGLFGHDGDVLSLDWTSGARGLTMGGTLSATNSEMVLLSFDPSDGRLTQYDDENSAATVAAAQWDTSGNYLAVGDTSGEVYVFWYPYAGLSTQVTFDSVSTDSALTWLGVTGLTWCVRNTIQWSTNLTTNVWQNVRAVRAGKRTRTDIPIPHSNPSQLFFRGRTR